MYTQRQIHRSLHAVFGPVWCSGRSRISPPRFVAEGHKRRLNQDSFVSAELFVFFDVSCLCVYFCDLY